ncbi:FecR family protein [Compostibacter hankyongensis]|uniref:FecR family protein n=1 Tax=Compostibacter hankyongensis TaxID=1007089 RepID=A0ABP8G174_9BACT
MSSDPQRLRYLFQRYLRDTGTPDELREFWTRFAELEEDDPVKQDLWRLWHDQPAGSRPEERDWDRMAQRIRRKTAVPEKRRASVVRRSVLRVAAAAAVLLLTGTGIYFLAYRKAIRPTAESHSGRQGPENDLAPGGNKAVLMLANGSAILLDSLQSGTLLLQGNAKVVKRQNGLVAYTAAGGVSGRQSAVGNGVLNTLRTPRGGQYGLILPDGTRVWLNAASSIRFPSVFGGKVREVELIGEAYFEVAHRTSGTRGNGENIPFIVKAGGMKVMVLGTHFNVNAYRDEAIVKTTLLRGSVRVSGNGQQRMLLPGQQARLDRAGKMVLVEDPDLEAIMAWKNGYFQFQSDSISTIMRQVSRWYNVDIDYQGGISQLFTGKVPRNVNVSTLLNILQSTGWVHFKIRDSTIVVEP